MSELSEVFPARRPLAAGDVGLETGYPGKICRPDGRRTTDARTQTHTPNRGRSIFILVLFNRF